jgi:hypothetical protein
MDRKLPPQDIEIAIGPHPARQDWSVLRVTYQRKPEQEQRVSRAVSALFPESLAEDRCRTRDELPADGG